MTEKTFDIMKKALVEKIVAHEGFPPRLAEALRLYNQGYTRIEAADLMQVTENTYAWYLKKIRANFGLRTRKELAFLEDIIRDFYKKQGNEN